MEPVSHSSSNFLLVGDGDKVQDIAATFITNEDGTFNSIATFWKPTAGELELLNRGGCMTLYIMSTSVPPVWLAVNHD